MSDTIFVMYSGWSIVPFSKLFTLYSFSNVKKRNKTINKCKVNCRMPHSQYRHGDLRDVVSKFPDWIFRAHTEQLPHQLPELLFPRYHGLVCWKPAFCAHRAWRNSSFYQEVQHSLCDYRDGGFLWTTRLHQILFQVRENCYRML